MPLISQSEFARRNNISQQAVSKACRDGRLPSSGGKLDADAAQAAWDRTKDPARAGRKLPRASGPVPVPSAPRERTEPHPFPTAFGGQSFTEVKTRRESVRLARDQVALKRELGELVNAAAAGAKVDAMVAGVKNKFLALAHRLAPALAIESDAAKCEAIVDAVVREILEDLGTGGSIIQ